MSRGADISHTKLKTACPTSTRGMSWNLVGLLALVAGLIRSASADDAHCASSDFAWANNKDGKDPCQVANSLVTKCSNAPFAMLGAGTAMYGGPGDNNECLCNLVEYNLLRVCAKCQGATEAWVEDFPDWSKNCAKHDQVNFGPGAPDGVSIPDWASGGNIGGPWNMAALKPAAPAQPAPSSAETPTAPEQPQAPDQQPESSAKVVNEQPPELINEPALLATPEETPKVDIAKAVKLQQDDPQPTTTSEEKTTTSPTITPTPHADLKADDTPTSSPKTSTTPKAYVANLREGVPAREAGSGEGRPNLADTEDNEEESPSQRGDLRNGSQQDEEAEASADVLTLPPSRHFAAADTEAKAVNATISGEVSSEPTKGSETSTRLEDSMPEEAPEEDEVPKLAGPTDLAVMPAETSTDTATELLTDQNTEASEDAASTTNDDVSTPPGDEPANENEGENGSLAKSGQAGEEDAEDIDPELEQYQYNGDPGMVSAESEAKGGNAKVVAICISVLAIVALTVIALRLFMCFRKRKAESDERESWMEADSVVQEKSEFAPPRGILSRQSVWDRIQRSLMPKTTTGPDPRADRVFQ